MPHAYRKERVVGKLATRALGDIDSAQVLCMGDLHMGDSHCDISMIAEAVKWLQAGDDRFCVIAGDLLNAALKDSVSDVYSEAMTVRDSRRALVKLLAPVADKVLAVVSGNHDHRVYKAIGDDICEIVCAEAGLPYHQGEAFLALRVGGYPHNKSTPVSYAMYVTHGFGGGRMVGGKANNLLRLRDIVSADCYVSGHTHTPIVLPEVCWESDLTRGQITERRQMFIATGASLDRGNGYAVRFGFPALAKVWPIVTFNGRKKGMTATVEN